MQKLINLPHLADQVFGVPHYATRQTMDSVKAVLIPGYRVLLPMQELLWR
nr:hypothetical protein [Salmonella enterica]